MSAITLHKGHQARVLTMALSIIWTSCWRSVLGFSREGGLLSEAGHSIFGHVCRKDLPVLDWNLCPWIEEADLLPQLSPLPAGLMGFPRAPLSWKDRPYFITANCPWDQSKERGSSKALKTWLGCCHPMIHSCSLQESLQVIHQHGDAYHQVALKIPGLTQSLRPAISKFHTSLTSVNIFVPTECGCFLMVPFLLWPLKVTLFLSKCSLLYSTLPSSLLIHQFSVLWSPGR